MTPSDIHPGQRWLERHTRNGRRREVCVLHVQDRICGYVEVRDEESGRVYPMRWHSLARRFSLLSEARAA